MKTLSEFLAKHMLDRNDFDDEEWIDILNWFTKTIHVGMEKYKEHLQKDCPKTVHWAMIEKQIVEALTKAEQMPFTPKDKEVCTNPKLKAEIGCDDCDARNNCKQRLVDGTFTQKDLAELSAKAGSLTQKDLKKLSVLNMNKVVHPICPLNIYFEGDEDKCDQDKCNFDPGTRSCSQACKVQGD